MSLTDYYRGIIRNHKIKGVLHISKTDAALLFKEYTATSRLGLTPGVDGNYTILTLDGVQLITDPQFSLRSNGCILAAHWEKLTTKDKQGLLAAFENAADKPENLHIGTLPFVTCLQAYKAIMFSQKLRHGKLLNNLRQWGQIISEKEAIDGQT